MTECMPAVHSTSYLVAALAPTVITSLPLFARAAGLDRTQPRRYATTTADARASSVKTMAKTTRRLRYRALAMGAEVALGWVPSGQPPAVDGRAPR